MGVLSRLQQENKGTSGRLTQQKFKCKAGKYWNFVKERVLFPSCRGCADNLGRVPPSAMPAVSPGLTISVEKSSNFLMCGFCKHHYSLAVDNKQL
jgi:hypothetical protein